MRPRALYRRPSDNQQLRISRRTGLCYHTRYVSGREWRQDVVLLPSEIARRAGHSVEVLLRVYAKCVHGQEEIANKRIEEILSPAIPDPHPAPTSETPATETPRPPYRDDPASVTRILSNARAAASRPQRQR